MRLQFAKFNQDTLRSEIFANLEDSLVASDSDNRIGKRVICPRSIYNSQRIRFCRSVHICLLSYWKNWQIEILFRFFGRYQDAIAVCREYHKPDCFITLTCNPLWVEILQQLGVGQTAFSRPDFVVRVFRLKLRSLVNDLRYHC